MRGLKNEKGYKEDFLYGFHVPRYSVEASSPTAKSLVRLLRFARSISKRFFTMFLFIPIWMFFLFLCVADLRHPTYWEHASVPRNLPGATTEAMSIARMVVAQSRVDPSSAQGQLFWHYLYLLYKVGRQNQREVERIMRMPFIAFPPSLQSPLSQGRSFAI